MKKFLFTVFLLCVLAGVLASAAYVYFTTMKSQDFALEEGYRSLYTEGSLEGWRKIGGEARFKAQGESIVGVYGPGKNTFLRTQETFGDFSLKLQMRWDELGNSGIMFRAQQRADSSPQDESNGRAFGYQYELDHSERSWSGGIYDEARRGWIATLENNPEARAAIRLNAWNDVEIEARGPTITTWINGIKAAHIIDALDARGFIALQVHAGDSGAIRWRRIRIKELPHFGAAGNSLLQSSEWRSENIKALQIDDSGIDAELAPGDAPLMSRLVSRRQFTDAVLRLTLPACEDATTVRFRYQSADGAARDQYAEVQLFEDRARARLLTAKGEQALDEVELPRASAHTFTAVALGDALVLTVDEVDVLRIDESGLPARGQLHLLPAACHERFQVADIHWISLKEQTEQVAFYKTLDTKPAPVLTPEQALSSFKLAPGFAIELVAAEPMVEDPVAMTWDEYGRLYVVEMRGYMPDAYGSGSNDPVGQVVRLEDVDGDGVMDTSEVFFPGLVNPRAIAVVNEGILVGEPPNLWLCPLPTRNGVCSHEAGPGQKIRVGEYGADVATANVEHMENGLRTGLDNWLYNAKSVRQLRLVDGELRERHGLFRGQWGLSKDDYGRWLYNHNSTWVQADFFAAEDWVLSKAQASLESAVGLSQNLTNPADAFTVRVNPGVNRAYLEGTLREDGRLRRATGVSGIAVYRGDQFPGEFSGDVFVPEAAGNVVAQFGIEQQGIALQATQRLYDDPQWGKREFLGSTDERFRPVDAMSGPDGALYIVDMYRGIIQDDHFLTDELREQIFQRGLEKPLGMGRIWRIRFADAALKGDFSDLANATAQELAVALASDNGWIRDTAQRLLLAKPQEAVAQLRTLALAGNTKAAIHALWVLAGRKELTRDLALDVLRKEDPLRQVQALRASMGVLTAEDLLSVPTNDSEPVRMQLAYALGQFSKQAVVRERLIELLHSDIDSAYVTQAVVRAVQGNEFAFLREWFASTSMLNISADLNTGVSAASRRAITSTLAANAYRTLRGDITSDVLPGSELTELLALAQSRSQAWAWQQIAMLEGFKRVSVLDGFIPAPLAAAPPIFSDGSISETDPLWSARLAGRVAFTWPCDELALGLKPLSPEQIQRVKKGEAFYSQCAACHGEQGQGVSGLAPALAQASWVTGPPEWLARIILQGMRGPIEINGERFDGVMPAHGHLPELDDDTLAGLMTYLRRSWGNAEDPVTTAQVAAIRAASAQRAQPWTAQELEAVEFDRGYARFEGKFAISFVTMTVTQVAEGLHLSVPMYGSGVMTPLSENTFSASAGGESIKLEFVIEPDGAVDQMILYRQDEKVTLQRKE